MPTEVKVRSPSGEKDSSMRIYINDMELTHIFSEWTHKTIFISLFQSESTDSDIYIYITIYSWISFSLLRLQPRETGLKWQMERLELDTIRVASCIFLGQVTRTYRRVPAHRAEDSRAACRPCLNVEVSPDDLCSHSQNKGLTTNHQAEFKSWFYLV